MHSHGPALRAPDEPTSLPRPPGEVAWEEFHSLTKKVARVAPQIIQATISAIDAFSVRVRFCDADDKLPGDINGREIIIDTFKKCRDETVPPCAEADKIRVPYNRIAVLRDLLCAAREQAGLPPGTFIPIPPIDQLFFLLHLFGHTVQWNHPDPHKREKDLRIGTREFTSEPWYVEESYQYEREANEFALGLFERPLHTPHGTLDLGGKLTECGVSADEFKRWLSFEFEKDWTFLRRFYESEGKDAMGPQRLEETFRCRVFAEGGVSELSPRSVPFFQAQRIDSHRQAFAGEDHGPPTTVLPTT